MSARTFRLAAILALLTSAPTHAQVVCTWNGTSGNWLNPALWSPTVPNNGTPPGATYNANVNGAGTITVDQPVAIQRLTFASGSVNIQNSTFANLGGGT